MPAPPDADCEGAAPQDRPDCANTDTTTVLPASSILLQHALASGDQSAIAVARRIVDGRGERRAASIRARREQVFEAADVERLEMDDRRRDAARRLPAICDGDDVPDVHPYSLAARDPLAASG